MAYLRFNKSKFSGKTAAWVVRTLDDKTTLGTIRWYGQWRKYCYFPLSETVFDASCLEEIANHLKQAQQDYKDGKVFTEDDKF